MADERPDGPLPVELTEHDETAGPAVPAVGQRKPRLRTVSLMLAGAVALILAVLAGLVGASLFRIVGIADEARNQTVPRVVQQHRDALSAAELGRLAEVILSSAERPRRAAALEEAEALSGRFARVAEPAVVDRLDRVMSALRLGNHRADLIDSLTATIREGLSDIDDALERATALLAEPDRGMTDYTFLASLYQLRRLYGQAMLSETAERLSVRDVEILTAIRAQRAMLAALPPGSSDHIDAMILLLQRFSDARTLSDLHRGRLAVRGQMRQDIDTAHRLLRDLSEGLAGGAAATTLGMADRIVARGQVGLWTGVAGVTITLALLASLTILLRRHLVAPVAASGGIPHALPDDPGAAEPSRTVEAGLATILQSVPLPIMIARRSDGRLLFANPQTAALLALPADRPPSLGLSDILDDPADASALPATLHRLNRPATVEVGVRAADGRRFRGVLTAVAIEYDGAGAMVLALQDTTVRNQTADALRDASCRAARTTS